MSTVIVAVLIVAALPVAARRGVARRARQDAVAFRFASPTDAGI